jgi:hypothetical protein
VDLPSGSLTTTSGRPTLGEEISSRNPRVPDPTTPPRLPLPPCTLHSSLRRRRRESAAEVNRGTSGEKESFLRRFKRAKTWSSRAHRPSSAPSPPRLPQPLPRHLPRAHPDCQPMETSLQPLEANPRPPLGTTPAQVPSRRVRQTQPLRASTANGNATASPCKSAITSRSPSWVSTAFCLQPESALTPRLGDDRYLWIRVRDHRVGQRRLSVGRPSRLGISWIFIEVEHIGPLDAPGVFGTGLVAEASVSVRVLSWSGSARTLQHMPWKRRKRND